MGEEINVKIGDQVIYCTGYPSDKGTLTKVVKITPTGRIRVAYIPELQFDKYGKAMGDQGFYTPYIIRATKDKIEEIQRIDILRKAFRLMERTEKITLKQAEKIIEILQGSDEDAKNKN